MKRILQLLMMLGVLGAATQPTAAQDKQKARIGQIKQEKDKVTVTVTSSKEFYVGGNVHILYLGDKSYSLYDQQNEDGKGMLKFYVPAEEFRAIKDGSRVYMSYGELVLEEGEKVEDVCKENFCPCWSLGKLNKKQLKK
jgi:hypothetical protein